MASSFHSSSRTVFSLPFISTFSTLGEGAQTVALGGAKKCTLSGMRPSPIHTHTMKDSKLHFHKIPCPQSCVILLFSNL